MWTLHIATEDTIWDLVCLDARIQSPHLLQCLRRQRRQSARQGGFWTGRGTLCRNLRIAQNASQDILTTQSQSQNQTRHIRSRHNVRRRCANRLCGVLSQHHRMRPGMDARNVDCDMGCCLHDAHIACVGSRDTTNTAVWCGSYNRQNYTTMMVLILG